MLGVFTFAGVVVLPRALELALVAVVYVGSWPTFKRAGANRYKQAYSTLTVAAGCWVASVTLADLPDRIALPAAIGAFMMINASLLGLGIYVRRDRAAYPYLRNPKVWATVLGTQWLGAGLGLAMHWNTAGSVALLPVIGIVHQESLRSVLRGSRAYVDGLWNQDGWLTLAQEAHRERDRFAIIFVDLPSRHEANVAAEVAQGRLGGNPIGRYSRTQLVILLRESDEVSARYLGNRLSQALRLAVLDAGVGCASDADAADVAGMLAVAAGEAVICRAVDAATDLR
jgi:hypothetical protein